MYIRSISIDQTSTRSNYRNRDSVLAILCCEVVGGEPCTADTSRRENFKSDHTCQVGTKDVNIEVGMGVPIASAQFRVGFPRIFFQFFDPPAPVGSGGVAQTWDESTATVLLSTPRLQTGS